MLRNFFLLNLILLAVAGYLGYNLYSVSTATVKLPAAAVQKKAAETAIVRKAVRGNTSSYDIIKNFNLFNPSRVSVIEKAETISDKPIPKNKPKLFGTVILGQVRTAIIEDPSSRDRKMYKLNESFGDYTVSEILKDKVVLLWNGEKMEIKLREDKGIKAPPVAQVQRTQQLQQQRRQQRTPRRVRPRRPRRIRRAVPPPPVPQQER